ncbi:conserved hypothetical protein [Streptomyces viridosporus ATCC 14672]|uniref:Uncharacterized protein n=1 Tax=Streptomyces viridosporus (strain ATCC 14672 / DSM 40746 / JCM 4963 / KCTC 9882 / NRRL B-12104 / FH 1290) TaxID=566461 RepID=D5ZWM8_STRV1|nr:conserved hypothetical protein [Streptomyces viridosporus ATCC 14672]
MAGARGTRRAPVRIAASCAGRLRQGSWARGGRR